MKFIVAVNHFLGGLYADCFAGKPSEWNIILLPFFQHFVFWDSNIFKKSYGRNTIRRRGPSSYIFWSSFWFHFFLELASDSTVGRFALLNLVPTFFLVLFPWYFTFLHFSSLSCKKWLQRTENESDEDTLKLELALSLTVAYFKICWILLFRTLL